MQSREKDRMMALTVSVLVQRLQISFLEVALVVSHDVVLLCCCKVDSSGLLSCHQLARWSQVIFDNLQILEFLDFEISKIALRAHGTQHAGTRSINTQHHAASTLDSGMSSLLIRLLLSTPSSFTYHLDFIINTSAIHSTLSPSPIFLLSEYCRPPSC